MTAAVRNGHDDLTAGVLAYLYGTATVPAPIWCGQDTPHGPHDGCPGRVSRRTALLRLAACCDDIGYWHLRTALIVLTPGIADNARLAEWWAVFCDTAAEWADLAPGPRSRVADAGSAMQVLDEWRRPYGRDPYAEAMAVANDLDTAIDAMVTEAGG